ncbi:hypothetical protein ABZP36_008148 [Zizania latifolia]
MEQITPAATKNIETAQAKTQQTVNEAIDNTPSAAEVVTWATPAESVHNKTLSKENTPSAAEVVTGPTPVESVHNKTLSKEDAPQSILTTEKANLLVTNKNRASTITKILFQKNAANSAPSFISQHQLRQTAVKTRSRAKKDVQE